jgi:cytochrome c biogenesis protein CcmG/thiol:disulfide interchange protein DsbE
MRHGRLLCFLLALQAALPAFALDAGATAPAFALPRADGSTLALDSLRGRVVLVDFWASWCAPCRKSFPALDALGKRYEAQGLSIVGVNVDTERAEADRFLAAVPVGFAIVFDADGKTPEAFGVKAMPSSYVIGRDGKVRLANLGFHAQDEAKLEAAVKAALAEASP